MAVITVDGVTLTIPDLVYHRFHQLTPQGLVRKILSVDRDVAPQSLTKSVIMGILDHLFAGMEARSTASKSQLGKPIEKDKMRLRWQNREYWKSWHAFEMGTTKQEAASIMTQSNNSNMLPKLDRVKVDHVFFKLPGVAPTALGELRPEVLFRRVQHENIPFPPYYFTRDVIMKSYKQLIRRAHPDAIRKDLSLTSPYSNWMDSWTKDVYWEHQHQLDTRLNQPQTRQVGVTAISTKHEAIATAASAVQPDTPDELDHSVDTIEAPIGCSESDSDGSSDVDDGYCTQRLDSPVPGGLLFQSSSKPPSPSKSLSSPDIPSSSTPAMGVRQAVPEISRVPSPATDLAPQSVVVQPALQSNHPSQSPTHVAKPTQLLQAAKDLPAVNPNPRRPQTALIINQVYRLPDAEKFILHKISLKFFSEQFLKTNRSKDVSWITAEVLVEAYRIFIFRFFPGASAAEKSEINARATSYFAKQYLGEHTEWLEQVRCQQVPVISTPAAIIRRAPTIGESATARVVASTTSPTDASPASDSSDVEILEVRVRPPLVSDQGSSTHPIQRIVKAISHEVGHPNTGSGSVQAGSASLHSQKLVAHAVPPQAQLLVDNMLYNMPTASRFALEELTVTSFSRAMYRLNAHYPARDLSQPLILKAYKSFVFNQYTSATFEAKMSACRKLDWPTPPVAFKEYLRNLEILERTQKKIGVVQGTVPSNTNAGAMPPVSAEPHVSAESRRASLREERETSLFVTPSPQERQTIPSKRSAEAKQTGGDVEAPFVRKKKQKTEGVESHAKHKKRRTTVDSGVGAGTPMLMSGALAFRPSPVPAEPSAETADGSPNRKRKKARKIRE